MTDEYQYKVVRLSTGEDIIAACLFDTETNCITMNNPMKFFIRRMPDIMKSMLIMIPWLPLEIAADDTAIIDYDDVITVIDPKESFVEYYLSMVTEFQVSEFDPNDTEFMIDNFFSESSDSDYEIEETNTQDLIEAADKAKKGLLH